MIVGFEVGPPTMAFVAGDEPLPLLPVCPEASEWRGSLVANGSAYIFYLGFCPTKPSSKNLVLFSL